MDSIFNNGQAVRAVNAGTYKTETALLAVMNAAIATATATGELFTCGGSCSGYSQQDIQNVMRFFRASGYQPSYSGTTLTLTW